MNIDTTSQKKKLAFALGGLAGNNAHGAGFLQAALDIGVKPDLISCTSGQIYWVANYLKELEKKKVSQDVTDEGLKKILKEDISGSPSNPIDIINVMLWGRPGKIAPNFFYAAETAVNTMNMVFRDMMHPDQINPISDFLHLFPGKTLTPEFSDEFYNQLSDVFNSDFVNNEAKIGIFFNSYDAESGTEYIYGNKTANSFWSDTIPKKKSSQKIQAEHRDITPESVRDALRIFQYGFTKKAGGQVDGEYFRPIILRELMGVSDIFVVKPINSKWIGDLPTSLLELEDMKTETSINGLYKAEKSNIELINRLIQNKNLSSAEYSEVQIHELEVQSQERYFDYMFEDERIFDRAYTNAKSILK